MIVDTLILTDNILWTASLYPQDKVSQTCVALKAVQIVNISEEENILKLLFASSLALGGLAVNICGKPERRSEFVAFSRKVRERWEHSLTQ
jgi:hypothetical protein